MLAELITVWVAVSSFSYNIDDNLFCEGLLSVTRYVTFGKESATSCGFKVSEKWDSVALNE